MDFGTPIALEQHTSDDERVCAKYRDGLRHTLSLTAGDIKKENQTPRTWEDATLYHLMMQKSAHGLSIKQFYGEMPLYENKSPILTAQVALFGDPGGKAEVFE